MGKIMLVFADDWSGLYINGKLEYEGHSIEPENVLTVLNIPYEEKWADEEWLNDLGRLPKKLSEVKFEK